MPGDPSDKKIILQTTAQYLRDEALFTVPVSSVSDTVSTVLIISAGAFPDIRGSQ